MKELKEVIKKLATDLSDRNHEALVLADESGSVELLNDVARALTTAATTFQDLFKNLEYYETKKSESGITFEKLDEMVALANAWDESGDPLLISQASVIDEVLLTIGAQKSVVADAKRAFDTEIEKIRAKQPVGKDPYKIVKEEHDKNNEVEEAKKLIADAVKQYRPLESGLNTRTCHDHPGAQMARIGDGIYQCSLDKGIYNYQSGFTTMKGNKIPGGDVANQTQSLYDRPNEFTSFDSRESRLNQDN